MDTTQCFLLVVLGFFILWLVTTSRESRESYNYLNRKGIQTYVLYIPKRFNTIKKLLEKLDIKPIYVAGFDKNKIQIKGAYDKGIIGPDWYRSSLNISAKESLKKNPPNSGRIACHLGHLEILRLFLKSEAKYALIFEDDLSLTPGKIYEQKRKLRTILDNIPKDAQIVYLSYCHELCNLTQPYNDIFTRAVRPLCRHIYLVSRKGARIILDNTLPMYTTGDKMVGNLVEMKKLKGYLVNPEFFSLNQNRQQTGSFRTNLNNYGPTHSCRKGHGSFSTSFVEPPKNGRVNTHHFLKNYK